MPMPMPSNCRYLVLDICGTIVPFNTTAEFARYVALYNKHRIVAGLLNPLGIKMVVAPLSYLSRVDLLRRISLWVIHGNTKSDLDALADSWVDDRFRPSAREWVLARIEDAQRSGSEIVIASATIDPVANSVGRLFGATVVVSSLLGYQNGKAMSSISFDATGKKHEILQKKGVDLTNCCVITDNASDASLIDKCSEATFISQSRRRCLRATNGNSKVEVHSARE